MVFLDNIGTYSEERLRKLEAQGRVRHPDNPSAKPRIKNYLHEGKGVIVDNIWTDIFPVNSQALEDMGYDTQKPEGLLERVIKVSSKDGALVADFFCGSGTTLAVAEKLGCRWIGCDVSRFAVHVTRKRLLGIDDCKPFEVLNLGKYERQYWQGVTFGESRNRSLTERALYEYLAFILKLYGAEPVPGLMHLHGKKGRALVHIGAVDAPVTIAEIDARENVAEKYGYWLRAAVQRWVVSLLFKQEISAAPHRCQSLDDINSGVVAALKQQDEGMSTEDVTFSKFIIDIIVTDMTTEQHHVIEDQYVDTTLNESQVTYRF